MRTQRTFSYARSAYANSDAVTQIANGVSTTTYGYDNNGNLTSAGTSTFSWDYNNRMPQAVTQGSTTTYSYDYAGNRVSQVNGNTTTIYPNKYYSVTSSVSGATTTATTTVYVWNGDTLIATVDQVTVNGVNNGTSSTRYIHPDNLGSTNIVSDESGNIGADYENYPYGETRLNQTTYPTKENRRFIGQFTDANNLQYLNARYLNSQQGQFLSEDPLFLGDPKQQTLPDPQSLNSYSYANDNPITKSDPTGRVAGVDDLIAFGVGGVVNFSGYTVTSAMTGQRMTWGGAANAFLSGGILGVGLDNAPETGGLSVEASLLAVARLAKVGAAAGLAGEAAKQGIDLGSGNQAAIDWGALASSPVKGALTTVVLEGALGNTCVPGLSCGSGNMYATGKSLATRMSNGTIGSMSASSAFRSAVGAQTAGLYKTFSGSLFDSVASSRSSGSSQSSGSSGGNAVSSWMGAFNPFQPH